MKKGILEPQHVGLFTFAEAAGRGVRFAKGSEGALEEGSAVSFYWLVDPEDGVILDVRFQAFGHSALLAAAEGAAHLLMGKTYEQARFLSADEIDQALRDTPSCVAFPEETYGYLNLVLFAIEEAAMTCMDIPLQDGRPAPSGAFEDLEPTPHPHWDALNDQERLKLIEEVLDEFIRPYVAMDGGGVQITAFKNGSELVVTYEGNCTSCFAATGSTLSSIQHLLQAKLSPTLTVVADESVLASLMQAQEKTISPLETS